MTRDRIKSRASLKGKVWPERREHVEYGERKTPWPNSHDADFKDLEHVSGEGSGSMMAASETTSPGYPTMGLVAADSPASLGSPSLDLTIRTRSKARAEIKGANPWKIKSSRISATQSRFPKLIWCPGA